MASSKFMERLVGMRSHALHRRLERELGMSEDVTADFLTRVGLGLLSGLRDHTDSDLARLRDEAEVFAWVTKLDFNELSEDLSIHAGQALSGAWWVALAMADTFLDDTSGQFPQLAGPVHEA